MRISLRTALLLLAIVPPVFACVIMWRDDSIEIEYHFAEEPGDDVQVVCEINKSEGVLPRHTGLRTYRIDVPPSHTVKLFSGVIFNRWHSLYVVTPRQKTRRRVIPAHGSRAEVGHGPQVRMPDGSVQSKSTEEGSKYIDVLNLRNAWHD